MLKWTGTKEEMELLVAIARRFTGANRSYFGLSFSEVLMDLEATHCNGCTLQLEELLQSEDSDFFHDVSGIVKHLNRRTGQLEGCFLPRYAQANHA